MYFLVIYKKRWIRKYQIFIDGSFYTKLDGYCKTLNFILASINIFYVNHIIIITGKPSNVIAAFRFAYFRYIICSHIYFTMFFRANNFVQRVSETCWAYVVNGQLLFEIWWICILQGLQNYISSSNNQTYFKVSYIL